MDRSVQHAAIPTGRHERQRNGGTAVQGIKQWHRKRGEARRWRGPNKPLIFKDFELQSRCMLLTLARFFVSRNNELAQLVTAEAEGKSNVFTTKRACSGCRTCKAAHFSKRSPAYPTQKYFKAPADEKDGLR